jgi:hypothetical protein
MVVKQQLSKSIKNDISFEKKQPLLRVEKIYVKTSFNIPLREGIYYVILGSIHLANHI